MDFGRVIFVVFLFPRGNDGMLLMDVWNCLFLWEWEKRKSTKAIKYYYTDKREESGKELEWGLQRGQWMPATNFFLGTYFFLLLIIWNLLESGFHSFVKLKNLKKVQIRLLKKGAHVVERLQKMHEIGLNRQKWLNCKELRNLEHPIKKKNHKLCSEMQLCYNLGTYLQFFF